VKENILLTPEILSLAKENILLAPEKCGQVRENLALRVPISLLLS